MNIGQPLSTATEVHRDLLVSSCREHGADATHHRARARGDVDQGEIDRESSDLEGRGELRGRAQVQMPTSFERARPAKPARDR